MDVSLCIDFKESPYPTPLSTLECHTHIHHYNHRSNYIILNLLFFWAKNYICIETHTSPFSVVYFIYFPPFLLKILSNFGDIKLTYWSWCNPDNAPLLNERQ